MIAFIAMALGAIAPAETAPADASRALVDRALTGDRRAFDELYRLHATSAHRLLARLVGPVPDLDDLLQHAFLEAFRALPSFRGEAAFATWLHRIVVHVAYRHMRRHKTVRWEDLPEELVAPDLSPEQVARNQQQLVRALRYLEALKPKKRIAFVLRVVEGMSLDEIGVLVGANAAAVGQRVKHAQRELAAMVERDRLRNAEGLP